MPGDAGIMDRKPKTTPVRISDEAIRWARIASGYTGESMAEYVSRIVVEKGREDADRLHAAVKAEKPPTKGKGTK
jgi:predicted DNA-binding protein